MWKNEKAHCIFQQILLSFSYIQFLFTKSEWKTQTYWCINTFKITLNSLSCSQLQTLQVFMFPNDCSIRALLNHGNFLLFKYVMSTKLEMSTVQHSTCNEEEFLCIGLQQGIAHAQNLGKYSFIKHWTWQVSHFLDIDVC